MTSKTFDISQSTVGELVAERPGRSRVFEQYGIDYCCGGKKTLADACYGASADLNVVLADLARCDESTDGHDQPLTGLTIHELADYIEQTHHKYLRESLPRLTELIAKVVCAHGDRQPELGQLQRVYGRFRSEIELHTQKEELILFPMCRALDGASAPVKSHCGSVANPIRVMIAEHDDAGAALSEMRALTNGFTPPPGACNTYLAMLQALDELEKDTHRHIHTENSILFPRAVAAEQQASR